MIAIGSTGNSPLSARGDELIIESRVTGFQLNSFLTITYLCFQQIQPNMILKELVRLTILLSLIISSICIGEPQVETIKQWNLVTYDFPYDWPVGDKDLYNGEQIVTTGFEIGNDRIFLATPRLFSGVPATISTVPRDIVGDSPVLKVIGSHSKKVVNTMFSFSGVPRLVASLGRLEAIQLQ